MTEKIIAALISAMLFTGITGCGREAASVPVKVLRLDRELASGMTSADAETRVAAEKLFAVSGYGTLTDSSLSVYNNIPSIAFHREAVEEAFPDMNDVESGLGEALGVLEKEFPAVVCPKLYAIISPFNQSVITVDSVMFLGLNHYLGIDYEAYEYFPEYIRKNKRRERIVPDIVEALIRQYYPYEPRTGYPTALTRMLYEGSVVEAVIRATGLDEKDALGMDEHSYEWLENNEKEMWNALVTRRLLYSTDERVGESLVRPSAVTSILHSEAPGMAGRFIGHRIVKSYLKNNNELPPYNILLPEFYDGEGTLAASKYH